MMIMELNPPMIRAGSQRCNAGASSVMFGQVEAPALLKRHSHQYDNEIVIQIPVVDLKIEIKQPKKVQQQRKQQIEQIDTSEP